VRGRNTPRPRRHTALIVHAFFEAFTKELPMEYAVELNGLITLQMEGSIG
jgi:Fe-S cluster assembly scaffold protein SufB